ncbi:AraC family transcriptional regulator [Paenibacillus sp.]|uniref:AraC family transcriptional regulator n=1 Tax=Paenibacillus sp. TaxID=58172 RepID=UPI002810FC10|nr:AraC family transcriptional regulator [Paenibacillus sp.]
MFILTRISCEEPFPLRGVRAVAAAPNWGKARCEIGWDWSPAPLPDYDLWYVVTGRGELRLGERAYPLRKGACVLLHPQDRPQAVQDPDDRLTVVFIHFRLEPALPHGEEALPERAVYLKETYEFEWLLHRMLDCLYQPRLWGEDEFDGLMKLALLSLLRASRDRTEASPSRKEESAVRRVVQYIREHAGQRLTREELARQAALSPEYLSRVFKASVGVSLKEYITQARLERAVVLLAETSMNVSQVSDSVGYSSVFQFSKQFKRRYGVPPSSFMRGAFQARPHP